MSELETAPEIDLKHQPVVVFCENKDMAWMLHDMLKAFRPPALKCVTRLIDLNELAQEMPLGVVVANPESEKKAAHVMSAVGRRRQWQLQFLLDMMAWSLYLRLETDCGRR